MVSLYYNSAQARVSVMVTYSVLTGIVLIFSAGVFLNVLADYQK